jgi:hypothetical protein
VRRRWLTILAVCGGGLFLLVFALRWYNRAMLAKDVDHLYEHVLARGNAEAAYQSADVDFRALYPREVFLDFARRHPNLFARDKLTGVEVQWRTYKNQLFVVITTRVDEGEETVEVQFYCRQGSRANSRLIGISPGLLAAVPRNLEPYPAPGSRPTKKPG